MKPFHLSPLLLLAAGCHPAAPGYTPTPTPVIVPVATKTVSNVRTLMPLDVGNQWSYHYRSEAFQNGKSLGQTDGDLTYRVASRSPEGVATLELVQDGQVQDRQGMRSDEGTVYQVSEVVHRENGTLSDVPYSPPQPIVLLPLTPGRHFGWTGRGVMSDGKIADGRSDSEILTPERVDTGMGPISAVPVVTKVRFGTSQSENTTWFRPEVGMMRYRQETNSLARDPVTKKPVALKNVLSLTLNNYAIQKNEGAKS